MVQPPRARKARTPCCRMRAERSSSTHERTKVRLDFCVSIFLLVCFSPSLLCKFWKMVFEGLLPTDCLPMAWDASTLSNRSLPNKPQLNSLSDKISFVWSTSIVWNCWWSKHLKSVWCNADGRTLSTFTIFSGFCLAVSGQVQLQVDHDCQEHALSRKCWAWDWQKCVSWASNIFNSICWAEACTVERPNLPANHTKWTEESSDADCSMCHCAWSLQNHSLHVAKTWTFFFKFCNLLASCSQITQLFFFKAMSVFIDFFLWFWWGLQFSFSRPTKMWCVTKTLFSSETFPFADTQNLNWTLDPHTNGRDAITAPSSSVDWQNQQIVKTRCNVTPKLWKMNSVSHNQRLTCAVDRLINQICSESNVD